MGVLEQEFDGRVAIVFGASRGIGAAAARGFAGRGAAVVLASRDIETLEQIAREIRESGGQAEAVQCDVTQAAQVQDAVARAVRSYGRLDLALNNAGGNLAYGPLGDTDVDDFDRILALDLRGVFLAMRFEIAAMLHSGGGTIVNMSSTAGLQSAPGIAAYSAAKHGVIGLTKSAALDYATRSIRVNAIAPGSVRTAELVRGGQRAIDGATRSTPMRRLAEPEEIAEGALWLCSERSSYVSGEVLVLDGGRMAAGA